MATAEEGGVTYSSDGFKKWWERLWCGHDWGPESYIDFDFTNMLSFDVLYQVRRFDVSCRKCGKTRQRWERV